MGLAAPKLALFAHARQTDCWGNSPPTVPAPDLCLHLLHMKTFCASNILTGPAFTTVPRAVTSLPR